MDRAALALASFMLLLDGYVFKKTDSGFYARVELNIFSESFTADSEPAMTEAIGQWLCGLPKGVWEDKKNRGDGNA
jgi:hypothetical protein